MDDGAGGETDSLMKPVSRTRRGERSGGRPRVAVVVKHYAAYRSPPILLLLDFLEREGWDVTLVLQHAGPASAQLRAYAKVLEIPRSAAGKATAALGLALQRFDVAIAFDPHSFHLVRKHVRAAAVVYYSLELFVDGIGDEYFPPWLAAFMREEVNRIAGLIIQSEERRAVFASEHGLGGSTPVFLLPVCARAGGRTAPGGLSPAGPRRLLHIGGLKAEQGIPRFCEAMAKVEGWELLLHGHGFGAELEQLRNRVDGYYAGYYPNTRLSQAYFETPEQAEALCAEADVGLAWYDTGVSPNLDTAALSSGKIAAYLKYGLPLIVSRGSSFVERLEAAGCAVALETPDDLPLALAKIEANYTAMSAAALSLFASTYDASLYEPSLREFLTKALPASLRASRSLGDAAGSYAASTSRWDAAASGATGA